MSDSPPEAVKRVVQAPAVAAVCADCGTATGGNYCPACGQETRLEIPGIGRFIGEIASEQFGIEGRLGRTLAALLFFPGKLTQEFVAGRRQRYIRPARLYLSASVIFFAALGFSSGTIPLVNFDDSASSAGKTASAEIPEVPEVPDASGKISAKLDEKLAKARALEAAEKKIEAAADAEESGDTGKAKTNDARTTTGEVLHVYPDTVDAMKVHTGSDALDSRLKSRIGDLMKTPKKEVNSRLTRAMLDDAPALMFLLLPLFAACLKLFYIFRGMRYGVHLLFAVHFHSFVFLDLLLRMLPWPHLVKSLLIFAIPIYLAFAMRRVYSSGVIGILLRMAGLALVNSTGMFVAAIIAIIFSMMFGLA